MKVNLVHDKMLLKLFRSQHKKSIFSEAMQSCRA